MRHPVISWSCLVLVALTLATTGAEPEPWPRWRGRDGAGQGGTRRFPASWTETDCAWIAPLPGSGHASPVIVGGRIFTASADEAAKRRFVTCHALDDGKLLWRREIPGPIGPHHQQNGSASGSVAVDASGCYWTWATGDGLRVEAFTLDGAPKWHADLGPYAAEHGYGATPALWRDLLIVPNDQDGASFVAAYDTDTGRERWRLPRESGKASYATPLVIDAGNGQRPFILLASNAHGVTAVEPTSGRMLWERRCLPKRAVSSPVLAGMLAIATCGDGGGDNTLVALRLPEPQVAAAEPDVAYSLDRSVACYVPTPLVVGQRMYLWGDRGVVTCVDAATGAVRWRGRVGGTYSASPVVVGGTVRNVSSDGEVVVIAEGDRFEELGRTRLGEECRATPAVAAGRMVYRTVGRLLAIDALPDP